MPSPSPRPLDSHPHDSDVDEKKDGDFVYAGEAKHRTSITAMPVVDKDTGYPTGIRAALILLALCLALFLISLDMVCHEFLSTACFGATILTQVFVDDCLDRHSQNHR